MQFYNYYHFDIISGSYLWWKEIPQRSILRDNVGVGVNEHDDKVKTLLLLPSLNIFIRKLSFLFFGFSNQRWGWADRRRGGEKKRRNKIPCDRLKLIRLSLSANLGTVNTHTHLAPLAHIWESNQI